MVAHARLSATATTTAEAFLTLAALPENADKRLELINGVVIDMPPSSKVNGFLAFFIASVLWGFVNPRKLGVVTAADSGYKVSERNVLQPDAAFIAGSRIGGRAGVYYLGAPDLAVEVISPSETSRGVLDKTRTYLTGGGRLVWTVYPEDKIIDVHRLADDGSLITKTLTEADTLDGGEVLPGFTVGVKEVFDVLQVLD